MGALKLNTQRAMISLFGRDNQYVLAEATRTLSLQNDDDHNQGDALWVGCCQLDYERSFCKYVFDLFTSGEWPGKIVMMVPNLKQDARFAQSCDIQEFPYVRFFTSVPIVSPKGVVIGAYTVLDKKPRTGLGGKLTKFLIDMSKTVMDYLQTTRSKSQHYRAERMMVGIGSFLEGRSSLRNSWLESRWQDLTASEDQEAMEGPISLAQQTKQVEDEKAQAVKATKEKSAFHHLRPSTNAEMEVASDRGSTTDSLSGQVADAFFRAANIAREAMEVEGVAYFDANFGSYGSLVGLSRSDSGFSGSESSTLGDTAPRKTSHDSEKFTKPSDILAFSTSMSSSVNCKPVDDRVLEMSETLLKGLLHRYPRGKVFNFSEDGMLSSSDYTDGGFHDFSNNSSSSSNNNAQDVKRTRKYKKTRQRVRQNDAKALLELAPGARSIIFVPLWDSQKKRWYSGCIAWARIPQRIFSLDDELTFLFGLGNCVMAEIHRLGAEYAERTKSDLISSLSHELRSPLHGVFGTVELLSDTTLSASQYAMIHAISSCASTLLDTIDHLLDYARINRFPQPGPDYTANHIGRDPSSAGQSKVTTTASHPISKDVSDTFTAIQLDSILEQVVESVFAGYAFLQDPIAPYRKPSTPMGIFPRSRVQADYAAGGVKVILVLENASDWRFLSDAGKWRLIVLNILGNALKFTSTGHVCVTLDASSLVDDQSDPGKPDESQVTLTVEDTGVGICKQYAQEELFTAFSQEDALSSGHGLGLHVTRRTVLSLGGEIKVNSQKNVGTRVVTKLNLQRPPELAPPSALGMNAVDATRVITRGKSVAILRLGWNKADEILCSSLSKICRDWFGMDVHIHTVGTSVSQRLPRCEYYIVTREDMNLSSITPAPGEPFAPPMIVLCSSPANASRMYAATQADGNANVIEYISQPCGPHKLAKTFKLCSSNQQIKRGSADEQESLPTRPATSTPKVDFMSQERYTRPLKFPEVRVAQISSPSPATLSPAQASPNQTDTARTVLIVDDNEINVRILAAYMKKLAYDYIVARNGLEALDAFKADPVKFKLILMGEYIYTSAVLHTDN